MKGGTCGREKNRPLCSTVNRVVLIMQPPKQRASNPQALACQISCKDQGRTHTLNAAATSTLTSRLKQAEAQRYSVERNLHKNDEIKMSEHRPRPTSGCGG